MSGLACAMVAVTGAVLIRSATGLLVCQTATAEKVSQSATVLRVPIRPASAADSRTTPPKSSASRSALLPMGDGIAKVSAIPVA